MNTNSRFSVATQILIILATDPRRPMKSAFLAESVNTNPVVVRRIVAQLQKAGIVKSTSGPGGGTRMQMEAAKVTLARVYRAVDDGPLSHPHYQTPNPNCPVGAHIQHTLEPILQNATAAFIRELARFNIEKLTRQIGTSSGLDKMIALGISVAELQNNYTYTNGQFIKK